MRTCEQTLNTNTRRIQTKKSSTNVKDDCHFMSNTIKSKHSLLVLLINKCSYARIVFTLDNHSPLKSKSH